MLEENRDILLFDGKCIFCHRLAFFMDKRLGRQEDIAFRPIKFKDAKNLIKSFSKKHQNSDTVYLYRKGKSYIRSSAAIRCLLYLKWNWNIWFYILWVVPLPIRDLVYRIIAANRHKIFLKKSFAILG